jgi:hypothetical protein
VGYEINFSVELQVTRIEIETYAFEYQGRNKDALSLTIEVVSDLTPENSRKLTGEVSLVADDEGEADPDQKPFDGSWYFATAERFRADIVLPKNVIERFWFVSASKPQWLRFCISEGPEVTKLGHTFHGKFRIRFRAGNEISLRN